MNYRSTRLQSDATHLYTTMIMSVVFLSYLHKTCKAQGMDHASLPAESLWASGAVSAIFVIQIYGRSNGNDNERPICRQG